MPASRLSFKRVTLRTLTLIALLGTTLVLLQGHAPSPVGKPTMPAINVAKAGVSYEPVAQSQEREPAAIEGWVVDKETGAVVADAAVTLGVSTVRTDAQGYFLFSTRQAEANTLPLDGMVRSAQIAVNAQGYADWTITQARYYVGDVLRLYPKLASADQGAIEVAAMLPRPAGQIMQAGPPSIDVPDLTGKLRGDGTTSLGDVGGHAIPQAGPGQVPATIRVYRTQQQVVEVVPFRDYVKHVLPMEWIPSWEPDALKAGAMAVKSYAWYWISRGGKQGTLGADVKDNVEDQVYDPNVSYASTDAAVEATFPYAVTIGGALFQAQYCAGSYAADPAGDCPWQGPYMTQWGTSYHADHGRSWGWIVQFYYAGSVITPNPPGGGYDGTPQPTRVPRPPTVPPTAAPPSAGGYSVGQGSTQPELFTDAYDRNGGAAVLGKPVSTVKWWLTYVSENNVVAQRFSGPDGRGNIWIVFDVLKSTSQGVNKAFLLNGNIGIAYAAHTPPGPEWVGAPTSDPVGAADGSGTITQTFARGTLVDAAGNVQLSTAPPPAAPTDTPVPSGGTSVTNPPQPSNGRGSLRVRVQWLGRQKAPSDTWVLPLALTLSVPGNPSITSAFKGVTDRNGVALYPDLPVGRYDVHVKGPHSVQSARANIALSANVTVDVDMKAQIEGDVDGDNCVTIDDFSYVQALLGTDRNAPGFSALADLNGDGSISMSDISLLRSGFERCGDISADTEFTVQTVNHAPTLSDALAPWTNPTAQQHNLSLALSASAGRAKVGDIMTVNIIAQTGSQPIDGASFVLNFDAQTFLPVDSRGNPADGIEPGYALPAVMGNWVNVPGGNLGFSTGMLQGDPPSGAFVVATARFKVLATAHPGPTTMLFASAPSPHMQLTNGGDNLLAKTSKLVLTITP